MFLHNPKPASVHCLSASAVVVMLAAICLTACPVQAAVLAGFSRANVVEIARGLSREAYVAPNPAPALKNSLDYDAYHRVAFRREFKLWNPKTTRAQIHLLPTGWIYGHSIKIHMVKNGRVTPLVATSDMFNVPKGSTFAQPKDIPLSGFRLAWPMNNRHGHDDVIVFQGASYFRALSAGQHYGLSTRGLAINTAQPAGEEFPSFRSFWIEQPKSRSQKFITVHALLDSPSVTGAYTFRITPGKPTTSDVTATLFPRTDIAYVGLAPLTSMYLFSSLNRTRISDFREAVHDSDGLAIWNGKGEQLWRPLANPKRLQSSSFVDNNPKAFGLIQRQRNYAAYKDLEARYERRPSAWITPVGKWGKGSIDLIEIPTEEEYNDNIVAFWHPTEPSVKGKAYTFRYQVSWPDRSPMRARSLKVVETLAGHAAGRNRPKNAEQFIVEYAGSARATPKVLPKAYVSASNGKVTQPTVQFNPETKGYRVAFELNPKHHESIELRLSLTGSNFKSAEVWLYRWTKN